MAVTSTRVVTANFSGEGLADSFTFNAANNALSSGSITIHTLSGSTVITFPTGGANVQAATIVPPSGNTNTITLKGTTADTGISLHKTDPSSIAIDTTITTQTSLVLTVGSTITGLRIVWT